MKLLEMNIKSEVKYSLVLINSLDTAEKNEVNLELYLVNSITCC